MFLKSNTLIVSGILPDLQKILTNLDAQILAYTLLTFFLWIILLILSYSTGDFIVNYLLQKVEGFSSHNFISLALGFGLISYSILFLGLAGILSLTSILILLSILLIFPIYKVNDIAYIKSMGRDLIIRKVIKLNILQKAFLVIIIFILSLTLLQALTPPWDYDGLMYHLEGPKRFLAAGKIISLPDLWQANGPFTVEMLYTIGEAFQLPSLSKLVHTTYAVLLVVATYCFGKSFFGSKVARYAAAILIGIPILPFWASLAYADMAWALYELLGLYSLLFWMRTRRYSWLILSAVMWGFALGSKYLALGGFGLSGLLILWHSKKESFKLLIKNAMLFGSVAFLIGSPWYLKNWILTGNPVYPLYFGGILWSQERVNYLMNFLNSFGTGRSVNDYVLLPWNLYFNHKPFTTFLGSIEIPSLIFPILLLYPFFHHKKELNLLAIYSIFRFLIWSLGSHQIRFLLPLFPHLAILSGSVMVALEEKWKNYRVVFILTRTALISVILLTLIYSLVYFQSFKPLGVITGIESRESFLSRVIDDYEAITYIKNKLGDDQRVLMLWDGQGYYCDERCVPDPEQSQWTQLVANTPTSEIVAEILTQRGITHVLYSALDHAFISHHDPTGATVRAGDFFFTEFVPRCAKNIYQDRTIQIYEITCR